MKITNGTHWRTDHLKAILQRAAEQELEPAKRKAVIVTVSYSARHGSSSGCASIGGRHMTMRLPKGPSVPKQKPVAIDTPTWARERGDTDRFWIRWVPVTWKAGDPLPRTGSYIINPTRAEHDAELIKVQAAHDAAMRATQPGTPEYTAWRRHVVLSFAHTACHEFAHLRGMHHRQMPRKYTWDAGWQAYVAWANDMPLDVTPAKVKARPDVDAKLAHVVTMRRLAETRAKRAQTLLRKWRTKERYYLKQQAARAAGR